MICYYLNTNASFVLRIYYEWFFSFLHAAVPVLKVGDPCFNIEEIIKLYRKAVNENTAVVVFPELSITGIYMRRYVWNKPRLSARLMMLCLL